VEKYGRAERATYGNTHNTAYVHSMLDT